MVIPWTGFPLAELLKEVEPLAHAKYVRFETAYSIPSRCPARAARLYPWPYAEGLRLDEAMHDLTILATGLYGKPLPPQDGAPSAWWCPGSTASRASSRSSRSIWCEQMPATFWIDVAPNEYGFYANVNPDVSITRAGRRPPSGASARLSRRKTLLFNGYAEQVARLCTPAWTYAKIIEGFR